jgi:hypothetical protein
MRKPPRRARPAGIETCDHDALCAWFVEPVGSITEPVTFIQVPGEGSVRIVVGDLWATREILRDVSQQTGVLLVEIDGVDGLAVTDPHWDGQSVFICKNPHCGKLHDVHLNVAQNLFARCRA